LTRGRKPDTFRVQFRGDHKLSERDAAVVRWNPLVPVRAESFTLQTPHRAFRKIGVLKAPAGQNNALLSDASGRFKDYGCQRIMERRRNFPDRHTAF